MFRKGLVPLALLVSSGLLLSVPTAGQAEPATTITAEVNKAVLEALPFADRKDFKNAARGLLRKPETLTIMGSDGRPV